MLLAGFLTSIFLEYVNPATFLPIIGTIKIGTIIPYLLFLIVLSRPEPVSNLELLKQPNTKWLIYLVFLILISIVVAEVTLYPFEVFKRVLGNIVWFVIIVKVVTDLGKLKTVFKALVWSHVIILILNPVVILDPANRSYLDAGSFLGDGNDFALSVNVVLPMCLVLLGVSRTRLQKIIYIGATVVLILAIVGTQSRGGTLAMAGSLGFLWWFSERRFAGLIVLFLASLIVFSFAPPQYFERMETIADYEEEGSARSRIEAWKAAVRMAAKHPVTGVGAGHFPVAIGTDFQPSQWGGRSLPWMTAHSSYFLILGELGIPGIIFLVSLVIGNFFRLRRLRRQTRGSPIAEDREYYDIFMKLTASLVAFAIGGAFLSATYYPHIYLIAGLITATTLIYEQSIKSRTAGEGGAESGPERPR